MADNSKVALAAYTFKLGRVTKEEEQYIIANIEVMTLDELSKEMNRDVKTLQKVLKRISVSDDSTIAAAAKQVKSRPYWNELENQFNSEELQLFVEHWHNIVAQFKNDTFYTEELQIVEVIKLEILSNRILTDQNRVRKDIEQIEKDIIKERKDDGVSPSSIDRIRLLETRATQLYISLTQYFSDYEKLLTHKKKSMTDIKGSRADRIKQLESSRESFAGWFRNLMLNPVERRNLGQWMEKMRIATDYEVIRLSEYHQYENKELDLPLLTPESVLLEHKEEIEIEEKETEDEV